MSRSTCLRSYDGVLGALRVPVEFLELGFGLRLPRHTPELGDVVLGLLVGHGLFKAFECGVHLWDGIATLDDVERGVLNVAAVQLNAIGLIQRVRLLQESVDLMDVIPLFALAHARDRRRAVGLFLMLHHRLSSSDTHYSPLDYAMFATAAARMAHSPQSPTQATRVAVAVLQRLRAVHAGFFTRACTV